jgi:hypothetical protein
MLYMYPCMQTCLTNQIKDLIAADQQRINKGLVPLNLVTRFTYGSDSTVRCCRSTTDTYHRSQALCNALAPCCLPCNAYIRPSLHHPCIIMCLHSADMHHTTMYRTLLVMDASSPHCLGTCLQLARFSGGPLSFALPVTSTSTSLLLLQVRWG